MSSLPADAHPQMNALLAEMQSRFDVAVEELELGPNRFRIASVRHPEKLLDTISAEEFAVDERLPYWAELWTSAIVLAGRVLTVAGLRGMRVLEIGCGLGLAGIAAAKAGASVTMTDYDEDALMFARWNVLANLDSDEMRRVRLQPMDWRRPPAGRYDVILGADVVYERRHVAPILSCIGAALNPGGHALIAEPDRRIGDEFVAEAGRSRLRVGIERVSTERRGRVSTVRLFIVRPGERP